MFEVYKVIKFNQNAWLKSNHILIWTQVKNDFEKDFFKLVYNAVFGKTMDNVRKQRYIELVTTEWKINYLVSEPIYHITKFFTENLISNRNDKKLRYL